MVVWIIVIEEVRLRLNLEFMAVAPKCGSGKAS